jgi:hypothetical protein
MLRTAPRLSNNWKIIIFLTSCTTKYKILFVTCMYIHEILYKHHATGGYITVCTHNEQYHQIWMVVYPEKLCMLILKMKTERK